MNLDKKVSNRIYEIRKSKNLTLEKLAELSEVDPSAIAKVERGERTNITLTTLEKILNGLNVEPEIFFDFNDLNLNKLHLMEFETLLSSVNGDERNEYLKIFSKIIKLNKK